MNTSRAGLISSPTCPLRQGGKMMRQSATKGGSVESISRRFEVKYLSETVFEFKIWISNHHVTEYLFEEDGQILVSRRETHRYGRSKYKRGELKTEIEMWAAFKKELDEMPVDEVITLPAKFLRLYLWKYPFKPKGKWKQLGCVVYFEEG